MKKFIILPLIVLASGVVYARLTGTNPNGASADVWCHGPKAKEVCQDSSADLIPTTNNVGALGTSSLNWNDLRVNTVEAAGAVTFSGASTLLVNTTTQLTLRTDAVGSIAIAQESSVAPLQYIPCISTAAATYSYVYFSSAAITVGPNVGTVVGSMQACNK